MWAHTGDCRVEDVLAYREQRAEKRREQLRELTRLSEEAESATAESGASVVLSVIFSAALDANVLYPFSLRDTLLRRAELELVPSAPGLPPTLVLNQRKRCRPAAGRR